MPHHSEPLTFQLEMQPAAVVLHLCGDADLASINVVARASAAAQASNPKLLIIDGSKLTYIGSMALGVLMRLRHALHAQGAAVSIAGTTPHITEMLRHLHIERLMPMHSTVAEALKVEVSGHREGAAKH
jgi:anti-sigma B factor antagonist